MFANGLARKRRCTKLISFYPEGYDTYSIRRLELIVPRLIQKGQQNDLQAGQSYTIFHALIIKWRDEKNKQDLWPRYRALFIQLLDSEKTDVNKLDRYGCSPLMHVVKHIEDDINLFNLLVEHRRVDVNLVSIRSQRTALEEAIQAQPECSHIVNALYRKTAITELMKENLKKIFLWAVEECYPEVINVILDLQLIPLPAELSEHKQEVSYPEELASESPHGLWIRIIEKIEAEVEILNRRNKLTVRQLALQRHTDTDLSSAYTNYSPSTFIVPGIPIDTYGGGRGKVGVLIKPTISSVSYWYNGEHEELTRDMSYHLGAILDNEQAEGQLWEASIEEIARHIKEEMYEKERQDIIARRHKRLDRYGVLENAPIDISFTWNEGLIRYHKEQIVGICLCDEKLETIKAAFRLKELLNISINFYAYSENNGSIITLNEQILRERVLLSSSQGVSLWQASSLETTSISEQDLQIAYTR